MEVSPPLRWLGALAIMLVVVLIVVPLLLQTVGDTIQLGGEPSEPSASEVTTPSEAPTAEPAANAEGGGGGGDEEGGGGNGDLPTTYTVQSGDTGSSISEQFYDSTDGWAQIAEANGIDPSEPLRVGVELEIPAQE